MTEKKYPNPRKTSREFMLEKERGKKRYLKRVQEDLEAEEEVEEFLDDKQIPLPFETDGE